MAREQLSASPRSSSIAIVGMDCCLPAAATLEEFDELLSSGRSGIRKLLPEELDRSLYFSSQRGEPGKTYTALGGFVPDRMIDLDWLGISRETQRIYDPVHLRFCEVAVRAWERAGFQRHHPDWRRTGVFVGHSGATRNGGPLALATLIDECLEFLNDLDAFQDLPVNLQQRVREAVAERIRSGRPQRTADHCPKYQASAVAMLPARVLGLEGPQIITDAACASSLFAFQQAMMSLECGRIDAAIVGGATTNGVDNLILFSQSQACSETGSRPFDQRADGLISSEGYAAVVLVREEIAQRRGLPILGRISGLGISSDGRGKSLWAPRTEGQQLALQRAYSSMDPLSIDYLEAHATSTQLGDATELKSVHALLEKGGATDRSPLLIGSVKSNLGHTLETAGVAGLIKILIAMRRDMIPPTLNFETPNANFDWSSGRITIVRQAVKWPRKRTPKRGAVSAFGIGGLNAHLVVEEAGPPPHHMLSGMSSQKTSPEPVAIVGRGVILPGASRMEDFKTLLAAGTSVIGPPPADRWRLDPEAKISHGAANSLPHARGGYLREDPVHLEGIRIPPKQIQQANPLQMMLLDAVAQAAGEMDRGAWNVDRRKTGVLIGTTFSGDFGNQLQLGLRLPEILRDLDEELQTQGLGEAWRKQLANDFRNHFLKCRPALLDETGSFTASTLASRIAKTFDLMGGACAVDADDVSGLAAIRLALDQLQSGHWELAVCGAAVRNMDRNHFEDLHGKGKLLSSGRGEEIPISGEQILPGEGVVVLLLERLSRARAAGHRIFGIIDDVDVVLSGAIPENNHSPVATSSEKAEAVVSTVPLKRQIGHAIGVLDLAQLVQLTTEWEQSTSRGRTSPQVQVLQNQTEQGPSYRLRCRPAAIGEPFVPAIFRNQLQIGEESLHDLRSGPFPRPSFDPLLSLPNRVSSGIHSMNLAQPVGSDRSPSPSDGTSSSPVESNLSVCGSEVNPSVVPHRSGFPTTLQLVRFQAENRRELLRALTAALADPFPAFQHPLPRFAPQAGVRVAVVASSVDEFTARLASVRKLVERENGPGVFETERALYWQKREGRPRIAWVFPGQGSHYPGVPEAIQKSPIAAKVLGQLDEELQHQGLLPFTPDLGTTSFDPANDLWGSQIWILGLSLALAAELDQWGLRPDVVLGHSFGEYSALVVGGCLMLPQVVRMVKARADAVATTVQERGRLISVRGTPSAVEGILRTLPVPVTFTHFNAPQQVVIAAHVQDVARVRQALAAAALAAVPLAVPVAFHTPRLAAAEKLLKQRYRAERFLAPNCGFLSATSVRYLSEPDDLCSALVRQLTQPVQYLPAMERLLAEDVQLVLEVGPNQVLSRLNRDISGGRALCLGMDVPGRLHAERRLLIQAAMEIIGLGETTPLQLLHHLSVSNSAANSQNSSLRNDVEIIDLHAERKESPVRPSPHSANPIAKPQTAARTDNELSLTAPGEIGAGGSLSEEAVRQFLLTVVVDLTGYDPQVIDFAADLEADLGIDSIKKAQVIGELAETFELSLSPADISTTELRTLEEIARIALRAFTPSREVVVSTMPRSIPDGAVAASAPRVQAEQLDLGAIERFLIDLVVDQTGYAPDVVDLDADMEGDLGIDSIKQAQLLGEVQQQFELSTPTGQTGVGQMGGMTGFSTLRSLLNYLAEVLPGNGSTAFSLTIPKPFADHQTAHFHQSESEEALFRRSNAVSSNGEQGNGSSKNAVAERHKGSLKRKPVPESSSSDTTGGVKTFETNPTGSPVIRGTSPEDEIPLDWQQLFAVSTDTEPEESWQRGLTRGRTSAVEVRQTLKRLIDRREHGSIAERLSQSAVSELSGLAQGAGVNLPAVLHAYHRFHGWAVFPTEAECLSKPLEQPADTMDFTAGQESRTQRFILRTVPAPARAGQPEHPHFNGPALILGDNDIARAIQQQFLADGRRAELLPSTLSLQEMEAKLEKIWAISATPHLFLTSSFDRTSLRTIDPGEWKQRRTAAVELPYRLCQLWMQRMIATSSMDDASVVVVTNLGGDFGFSGKTCLSPEGGLGGLIKAMLIEAWMQGYRSTSMKVIDLSPRTMAAQAVRGIWKELARPSYDMEVALDQEERFAVQAFSRPLRRDLEQAERCHVRRGGTWIVTGGARGITAVVARELARRHGLTMHLLGTAPVPCLSEDLRDQARRNRLELRRNVMAEAAVRQKNGMEAWRNVEKALEIDETLRKFHADGIAATYHCVDVSDGESLQQVIHQIREKDGPIRGVIHGAGIGQDARFERKRPDKVDQCLKAKIDGCIQLMHATHSDPLDSFVAFGSISGRFGANGHTDYSFANEMLAKLMGRYRRERPEVAGVTFHWHAWDDIGMAIKPETRLALEMIQLELMPAREGITHFLNELEWGGDEPEVLVTDQAYVRKFFPVERQAQVDSSPRPQSFPLLSPAIGVHPGKISPWVVELAPDGERFLSQHQMQGRPTLPFVIALEFMAEAARLASGNSVLQEAKDVEAIQSLKWTTSAPITIQTWAELKTGGQECSLRADFYRRDGRLVARDKLYFRGTMVTGEHPPLIQAAPGFRGGWSILEQDSLSWTKVIYPPSGGPVYHGPELQCLHSIAVEDREAFGKIFATSAVQLGGGHRPGTGWSVPAAAMDACLYAAALLAGKQTGRGSLPVRFDRIRFGRQPDPGEPCLVHVKIVKETSQGMTLAFTLTGWNNDLLLEVNGYEIGWLS